MSNAIVIYWNEKAATVFNIHTNPGDDSRRFAIIHIAIHDAINSIEKRYWCYALRNEKEKFASVDAAVSRAASLAIHWAIDDVKKYVQELSQVGLGVPFTNDIDSWANERHIQVGSWYAEVMPNIQFESQPSRARRIAGEKLGEKSFSAIIQNRSNDGRSEVNIVSSVPAEGVEPGKFRGNYFSIPSAPANKLLSNWGEKVKPFATPNNFYFRQGGPSDINSPEYTTDYNEVKNKGRDVNSTRSASETQLANLWNNLNQHIVWNSYAME